MESQGFLKSDSYISLHSTSPPRRPEAPSLRVGDIGLLPVRAILLSLSVHPIVGHLAGTVSDLLKPWPQYFVESMAESATSITIKVQDMKSESDLGRICVSEAPLKASSKISETGRSIQIRATKPSEGEI